MSNAALGGMNVLVTGGAGYIGSICVEELLGAGCGVTVFDNLGEGHRAAVDPRARLIAGDLLEPVALRDAFNETRPDAVVHFAASALVGESMRCPEKYFRNNVTAGQNLLDVMLETGVRRLVFSSSCATYGHPQKVLIDESTPQSPINPYGESKVIFEKMVRWYEQVHEITNVGLRFFNVAGASRLRGEDHRVETHLIPNILKVALGQRDHIEIFGTDYDTPDGTCVRDYVHVRDVAAAHLAALTAKTSGLYNLGNGAGCSVGEVLKCCRRVTGHTIPAVDRRRRDGDPPRLVADYGRIQEALGWRPRWPALGDIIESAWEWHRNYPHGYGNTLNPVASSASVPPDLRSIHKHG